MRKKQDAIIRRLEIIGEAVKHIPEEIRKQYPHITWKEAAGLRDIVIHEYFGISLAVIWKTITSDLPLFYEQIERVKKDLQQSTTGN